MDRSTLERYKSSLLVLRARVLGGHSRLAEAALYSTSGDLSGMPLHMADMGSETYEQEFTISLMESQEDALGMIDQALARIEDGTYGRCVECGKPIADDRLEVIPYTPECIDCASRRDR